MSKSVSMARMVKLAQREAKQQSSSSVTDTLYADEPFNTWQPCIFGISIAGMEWSASISENCSVLDHIPAATEGHLLSTVFLLNLLTLDHHHFI